MKVRKLKQLKAARETNYYRSLHQKKNLPTMNHYRFTFNLVEISGKRTTKMKSILATRQFRIQAEVKG